MPWLQRPRCGAVFPVIGEQKYVYLVNQLTAWRDESRTNDPYAMMRKMAHNLTDPGYRQPRDIFGHRAAHHGGEYDDSRDQPVNDPYPALKGVIGHGCQRLGTVEGGLRGGQSSPR